jgi:hypothetical protein
MPEKAMQGIPEVSRQDLEKPDQFAFKLNSILRTLAAQISNLLGVSGSVRMGNGPYTFYGATSFLKGTTTTGLAVFLGESDRSGNLRVIQVGALTEYANDTTAKAGGLEPGTFYRTATGQVMVVLPY